MASINDLVESLEEASFRANQVSPAVRRAVASTAGRMRATGVKISVEETSSGARVLFSDNPRSRAQVRLDPRSVAERAEGKLLDAADSAVRSVMSRD